MKSFYKPQASFRKLNTRRKECPFRERWERAQFLDYKERWGEEDKILKEAKVFYNGKVPDKALKCVDCMKYIITGEAFELGWGFTWGSSSHWKPTKREAIKEWNECADYKHYGWDDGPGLGSITRETLLENMLNTML